LLPVPRRRLQRERVRHNADLGAQRPAGRSPPRWLAWSARRTVTSLMPRRRLNVIPAKYFTYLVAVPPSNRIANRIALGPCRAGGYT
jgi:hypothetical protein